MLGRWGAGATCFLLSMLLQIPIYAIHVTIPSGVTSARADSPKKSPTRGAMPGELAEVMLEQGEQPALVAGERSPTLAGDRL